MNLQPLYEMQDALDEKIVKEKGLEGRDLLPEKILALQVELGELANEQRSWKFWSEDREPRVGNPTICQFCNGTGIRRVEKNPKSRKRKVELITIACNQCVGGYWGTHNPLLEEYVDCLHFILSIGNDLNCSDMNPYLVKVGEPIDEFGSVYFCITKMNVSNDNPGYKQFYYAELLSRFFGLGKSLGFDWEQIKTAYHAKNKVNHERQQNGY